MRSSVLLAAAHELKSYHKFMEGFAQLQPHMEAMRVDCEEWHKVKALNVSGVAAVMYLLTGPMSDATTTIIPTHDLSLLHTSIPCLMRLLPLSLTAHSRTLRIPSKGKVQQMVS